jgi:hypothetical protein
LLKKRIRSHHDISRALTDDLVKRVSLYITGDENYDRQKLDELATKQVFVFTFTADERRARACKAYTTVAGQRVLRDNPWRYQDTDFEFTEFDYLMCSSTSRLYGSRYRKPARRASLPFAAAYLDFAGSKYGLEAPPLNEIHYLHLHGLTVVPLEKMNRARDLLPALLRQTPARNGLLFNGGLIEPFDPAKRHEDDTDGVQLGESALENWAQYSVKGTAQLMMTSYWPDTPYRIYPNPNGQTYNYPRPPVGSPDRKVPFEA